MIASLIKRLQKLYLGVTPIAIACLPRSLPKEKNSRKAIPIQNQNSLEAEDVPQETKKKRKTTHVKTIKLKKAVAKRKKTMKKQTSLLSVLEQNEADEVDDTSKLTWTLPYRHELQQQLGLTIGSQHLTVGSSTDSDEDLEDVFYDFETSTQMVNTKTKGLLSRIYHLHYGLHSEQAFKLVEPFIYPQNWCLRFGKQSS